MTNQKQIRVDVYDKIEQWVDGLVSPDNITDTQPQKPSQYPAVVHTYEVSELEWNRNMSAPTSTQRDVNGNATAERYTQLHRASFDITVAALSKSDESDIHTTLKNGFQKYEKDGWDVSDINSDAFEINVGESTEVNSPDHSPKPYAHQFTVEVDFKRYQDKPVDHIDTIGQDVTIES